MKRIAALAVATALLAACGTSGPITAGPLTLPPTETTVASPTTVPPPTTAPDPDTTTTSTTPSASTTVPTTPQTTPDDGQDSPSATITVYFLDDNGSAIGVKRTVGTREVAAAAVQALIGGPTNGEAAEGLTGAFPAESLLLGVNIADGTATVDMSREFEAGGGSALILGRLAQLVYTLTEFPSIDRVRLLLDGQSVETFSGEGVMVGEPLTRQDFTGAVPIGGVRPGESAPTWNQDDLPTVTEGATDVYRVVLVAGDDVLNVRQTPGVEGTIMGKLAPGVAVRLGGSSQQVGGSTWVTVVTPSGSGWVNAFYLTRSVVDVDFPGGGDPADVVAELANRFDAGEDISSLISAKGLWVIHHSSPIRFDRSELPGLLDDPTTYRWGSNALEPDSPEITPKTFADAIAEPFVSVYDDPDRQLLVDEVIEGPNGRPSQFIVPVEFGGFPHVMIYDKGDNPEYGGLDWMSWLISLAYEDGEIKVVGLTIDNWGP
jgi:hypothetical protein